MKIKNRVGGFEKAAEGILQVLFPLRCPVCDEIVTPPGEKIHMGCLRKLKVITPSWCMRCGKKLGTDGEYCEDCQKNRHYFIRGRSLYEYGSAAMMIYRFKYGGRQEYADPYS